MSIFDRKYAGRGVKFIFAITPKLKEGEFGLVRKTLVTEPLFRKYFGYVDVTDFGDSGAWSRVKIYCPNALFTVSLSKAEKAYNEIFYNMFGRTASLCMGVLKRDLDIIEFDLLYRFIPKEKSGEFMPLITLKTIGAFIFYRKIIAKSTHEDLIKMVTDTKDKEKLKEIMKDITDARPLVEENKDFILEISRKLGILKPYTQKELIGDPVMVKAIKETIDRDKIYDGTEAYKGYMPLSDNELRLVNEYILAHS
jgi:hypothetical protein